MNLPRRQFVLAASAAALVPFSRIARAQPYPARPVRIIVGFPAGGTADGVARLIGQRLSEHFGQPFIVENRPGASSNIAAEAVVRSSPDGYTLLQVATTSAVNSTLFDKLNFNFIRDITPVAGAARTPLVMAVNPSVPAKSVPEFIAYAKANPDKINMGSAGVGNPGHVAGELFKMLTGVVMLHVPYKGSAPVVSGLLGGQVQVAFDPLPTSLEFIRAGKLRALAVTTATRSAALPDVPPLADFVPGYEASAWYGIAAPKNTPAAIVEILSQEIVAAIADPKVNARFANVGFEPMPMTSGEFGKFIVEETEKWGKVVRAANIKPE
jgi:tripartite-type tricarboxylate transporter receptor subunit TctC